MVAVTTLQIRTLAGFALTDAPSDTALTDLTFEAARYVAMRTGKSTIDPAVCTEGEAYVIEVMTASLALASRPSEGSTVHMEQAELLRRRAEQAIDDLLSTGKIWVDILGVNISR